MVKLIASREFRYAGRTLKTGEDFNASEKDAKLLVAISRASFAAAPSRADLPAEVMAREPVVAEDAADPNKPAGHHYRRRDLVVENGQIGETSLSQSSRRGRPPKEPT